MSKDDIIEAFEVIYSKPIDVDRHFKFIIYGEDNYRNFCKLLHEEATKVFNIKPKLIEKLNINKTK